jgi:MraZ protein
VFRGSHVHSIDAKGRTSLPARFREVLAKRGETCIVVTTAFDDCLDAYPLREWETFEEKLAEKSQFDPRLAPLRRRYVGRAQECEIDKLGRLLLPAELRKYGGLEGDVLWVGVGRRLELWNPQRFEAGATAEPTTPEGFEQMRATLTELGL